jgi:N6-adenosine-specific RNA methylase IME4
VRRYATIIADPPWQYRNRGVEGAAERQYPTMTTEAICALPVADLAAEDAVLLLWATWPTLLADAARVVAAWGFTYVTGFPWVKLLDAPTLTLRGERAYRPQYGTGFWVRGCTEPILVCRRGKANPGDMGDFCGIVSPNFRHSRKPENLYEYAEARDGPYLELFARRPRAGWDSWGNEVGSLAVMGLPAITVATEPLTVRPKMVSLFDLLS